MISLDLIYLKRDLIWFKKFFQSINSPETWLHLVVPWIIHCVELRQLCTAAQSSTLTSDLNLIRMNQAKFRNLWVCDRWETALSSDSCGGSLQFSTLTSDLHESSEIWKFSEWMDICCWNAPVVEWRWFIKMWKGVFTCLLFFGAGGCLFRRFIIVTR